MKNILVMIDEGLAWHNAAYTAYDIAAHMEISLIGAALVTGKSTAKAKKNLSEFKVGARAAGVCVDGDYFPSLADAWLAYENLPIDSLFISRESMENEELLSDWHSISNCPLWIAPAPIEIHKMVAIFDQSPGAVKALELAMRMSQGWPASLHVIVTSRDVKVGEIIPEGHDRVEQFTLALSPEVDLPSLLRLTASEGNNVTLLGCPPDPALLRSIAQQSESLLAIFPNP